MTVKYEKDSSDFLEKTATKVVLPSGDEWFYLPHWYKKVGEQTFEIVTFEKLPNELIVYLRTLR